VAHTPSPRMEELVWVRCNDSTCYTQVPYVFLLRNYKMHLFENKISSCIPHRYMLEMVHHPIMINVLARTTNGMQLIARIYVRQDVLLKAKLSHYTVWVMHLKKLKKYEGDNWCPKIHGQCAYNRSSCYIIFQIRIPHNLLKHQQYNYFSSFTNINHEKLFLNIYKYKKNLTSTYAIIS